MRGAEDQPVVGDDGDVGVGGLLEDVGEGLAVDGGDDQGVHALRDHVLDLRDLLVRVVLAVLERGAVPRLLQDLRHVPAVGYPALGRLGGHRHPDGLLLLPLLLLAAARAVLAAGGQQEGAAGGHRCGGRGGSGLRHVSPWQSRGGGDGRGCRVVVPLPARHDC